MSTSVRFRDKDQELSVIKKHAAEIMAKCNTLNVEYTAWFTRQQQTFIDAIKSVQVAMRTLAPPEINTMSHYRAVCGMALTLAQSGKNIRNSDKLECFLSYWHRFCQLQQELVLEVLVAMDSCLSTVSSLRQPDAKKKMDNFRTILFEQFSEDFNFTGAHNEKDNLYTYRLNVSDQCFLGLVSYAF